MYHYLLISMLISLDLYIVLEFTDAEIILLESDIPDINFSCPAKVGTSSISTFQVSVSYSDGRVLQIGQCNYTGCEAFAQKDIIIAKNSNSFDINVKNVNLQQIRNFSQLICKLDEVTTNYSIDVIAIPINSSCDTPRLTDDSTSVFMTCRSLKVFPQAKCLIHFSNKTAVRFGTLKYEHTIKILSDQVYYESKCTWISNISNFDAGAYNFFVTILPNVTDNKLNGQNITSLSLNLTLPTLQISKECFDGNNVAGGYIKPNATLNCLCFLEYVGNPPGSVKWLDSNGVDYGTKANYTFTYLNILPMHDLNTYYCTGITGLRNGTIFHSYTVKYAYGPNSCQLQLESTTFDLCYNKNILVNISCSVKNALVVPGYTLIFHVNGTDIPSKTDNQVLNSSTAQTSMNITSAGDAFFKCVAQNSKFEDVQTSCEKIIAFKEPPLQAPLLTITNISRDIMKAVQEEKNYNVTCEVSHGIPLVSNITIMCGNITKATKTGNVFTSPVTFTRNMTGQYCACEAQHITGCYINNSSLVKLNITYKSSVTNFTIQQKSNIVSNGTLTYFFCESDGNPLPTLSLRKGSSELLKNISTSSANFSRIMFCEDSGNYICEADNGITNAQMQSIQIQALQVFVKCRFQLIKQDLAANSTVVSGTSFFKTLEIRGYPQPSIISVFKYIQSNKSNAVTELKKNDNIYESNDKKVKVIISFQESAYINLQLQISNITGLDFTNYTLMMTQEEFPNFTFSFCIEEEKNNVGIDNDDKLLPSAVGGGIAAVFLLVFIVLTATYMYRYQQRMSLRVKKKNNGLSKTYQKFTKDIHNSDIYFLEDKAASKKLKNNEAETYKNYKDVIPTITSATAIPKNMYKTIVKPKPNKSTGNSNEYYNFVEPLDQGASDKMELLDENIYANHGFIEN